jgi:hypothetical protein
VDSSLLLQLFLLLNVFAMGALAVIAVRHAFAHFRPKQHDGEKAQAPAASFQLPPGVKQRLMHEAEATFLAELNRATLELQTDLKATATQLNQQLGQVGAEVTAAERERYMAMLEEIRRQTETSLKAAEAEIAQHQADLKAKLTEEQTALQAKMAESMAAEQAALTKQIDTKLADAVASFLTETLQHNVDLGAQTNYLIATLNEHKDEFKREVQDGEAPAAK